MVPDQEAVSRTLNQLKHQKIRPIPKSPRYHLALLFAACAVVFLPLAYLALISGLSALLWVYYDYLGWKFELLQDLIWLPLYLGPAISLATLVAFLLYPVFTTRATHLSQQVVHPKQQPHLYAFVAQLSQVLGVQPPQLISITHEANAFAGPAGGFLGVLRGERRLVIGLPLVEMLQVKQFGGILAHELGHFSQRNGQILVTLMRLIQSWFRRVVAEENHSLDRFTQRLSQEWKAIAVFILFARALLVITRFFFVSFGWIADVITGFLLRQMEYDADRYEARLIGRDVFAETTRELFHIQLAHEIAMNELMLYVPEGKLVDNLPAFTAYHRRQISGEALAHFKQMQEADVRALSDSHPTFAARVKNADRAAEQPILVSEAQAATLFEDFPALCRDFTRTYYETLLKEQFQPSMLYDVATLNLQRKIEREGAQALARFFHGSLNLSTGTLRFPSRPAKEHKYRVYNPVGLAKHRRDFLLEEQTTYRGLLNQYEGLLQQKLQYRRVHIKATFQQENNDPPEAITHDHLEVLNDQMNRVRGFIEQHEERLGRMWQLSSLFFAQIKDDDWLQGALRALPNWQALLRLLNQNLPKIEHLREVRAEVAALLESSEESGGRRSYQLLLQQKTTTMNTMTRLIAEPLRQHTLKFEGTNKETGLGSLLALNRPRDGSPRGMFNATTLFIEQFHDLRCRLIGRLCLLAERADHDAGLEPLPVPTPGESPANVLF